MTVKDVGTNWNRDTRNAIDENDKNLQRQINELVLSSGDSNVEVAQARVDSEGNTYSTLKERLDDKETKFSSQLAETATKQELNLGLRDKVDRVELDGEFIRFYSGDILRQSISIAEAGNASVVQAYIDTLVANGQIEGVTLAENSVAKEHLINGSVTNEKLPNAISLSWELGTINSQTGEKSLVPNDTRIRTTQLVRSYPGLQFRTMNNELGLNIFFYDLDGNFKNSYSGWSYQYDIVEDGYIMVTMRYEDDSVITDVNALASNLYSTGIGITMDKLSYDVQKAINDWQSMFITIGEEW